ncbi:MAG: tetratricopeptide repeat protein, partial [Acidobacteria bacterium]|nr:tetratricopeptide repeat protein [Acidobacteriota bacterium]MCA1640233.1 tetratricopeptide repeat protein [Acidobacteriota bacterium]
MNWQSKNFAFGVDIHHRRDANNVAHLAVELNEQGVSKALVENNYKEALSLFRRAVDIDSGCFTCRYNLGKSFLKTGNLDEAVETFTQLTKAKPDYAN